MHMNLNEQINELINLFKEYKKIFLKCREFEVELGVRMGEAGRFEEFLKKFEIKLELYSVKSLKLLKKELIHYLEEIIDVQNQFRYEKEKRKIQRVSKKEERVVVPAERKKNEYMEKQKESMASDRELEKKLVCLKTIKIPFYKAYQQHSEMKIDRISKYIASLKKNIKINTPYYPPTKRLKEYLLENGQYAAIKEELERYLMREEELEQLVNKNIHRQIQQFLESNNLSNCEDYYLLRVSKKEIDSKQPIAKDKLSLSQNSISNKVEESVHQDFEEMKSELENKYPSYTHTLREMASAVTDANEKLHYLRQKRIQLIEQNEQFWSHFV